MITNKDIRVENGFLVINGDKFPLDGQSPEAIMEIVEDNSDSTPTENSTAPITSGGVYAADKAISDTIGDITQTGVTGASVAAQLEAVGIDISNLKTSFSETKLASNNFQATTTNYEYTGCSYTVPQGKTAILYARAQYSSGTPIGVLLSWNSNSLNVLCATDLSGQYVSRSPLAIIPGGNTVYSWEKRSSVPSSNNEAAIYGIVI